MKHRHLFSLDHDQPISAEPYDYPAGFSLDEHCHAAAQLVYATSGTMNVTTDLGTWVVPSQRAVWIPPQMRHRIDMLSNVSMRTVYVADNDISARLLHCSVVAVSPLLRELILALLELPSDYSLESGRVDALVRLFREELQHMDQQPLHLREPADKRLRAITDALRRGPDDNRPLSEWARQANASERTLARLFLKETGMTFGQWRQQLRLLIGIGMLGRGVPVTNVAMDLGYSTPSAFSFMFRRALGRSPSHYFEDPHALKDGSRKR